MRETETYDVVVIGAGFAGLVAARDLLEAGRTVVVKRRPQARLPFWSKAMLRARYCSCGLSVKLT